MKKNKLDWINVILISISLILLAYTSIYIFNYYDHNGILRHYPNEFDYKNNLLTPNEIGDSIGGILNPIIGFTAAILTFLAFYIQFKANQDQRYIYYENLEKEKKTKENEHKVNLRIFKNLVNSMIVHYKSFGDKLPEFIESEKMNPLSSNLLKIPTDNSYEIFKNLDFKEIYSSIIFNFKNEKSNWEDDLADLLRTIDFYDKLLAEITKIYKEHTNKKFHQLDEIGELVNQYMNDIFSDADLKDNDALDDYIRIIYNKNPDNSDHIPESEFNFPNINDLHSIFFPRFLSNLYDKFLLKDANQDKYKRNLDLFSHQNKKLGNVKIQAINYATELEINYKNYFESNDNFVKILAFLNRINCG